ncbi:MAG: amidohydrolase [Citromicrobium sp.]|nr:amidohydrolase [Citromicrobium sp.]
MTEEILEPELPIIDPHHHLWDLRSMMETLPAPQHPFIETVRRSAYYTFDALHADTHSGHRILGTVYMECGAFYDPSRGEEMQVVGEVEFVNGVAAQGASGLYGPYRPCAGIVGHADMRLGARAKPVLEALVQAGNGRFRGIRHVGAWDADPDVTGIPFHAPEGLYRDATFREGIKALGELGLSFDAWLLEPQLGDVIDLARSFPDLPICLDHCGTPLGYASYEGKLTERFDTWKASIEELARCDNVVVKLGGLAMPFCALPPEGPEAGLSSQELADLWQPYLETCIEAFGPNRAMFESNYPVDKWAGSYATIWNAFKRVAKDISAEDKHALFAGTAARFYAIEHCLDLT